MSVKIRLKRTGARNTPGFRVVVADARSPRDGRFLETLGWYNPTMTSGNVKIDRERYAHWVAQGAQVSDTVRSLLKRMNRPEPGKKDVPDVTAETPPAAPAEEAPVTETNEAPAPAEEAPATETSEEPAPSGEPGGTKPEA